MTIALLATIVAVPRAVAPSEVPEPNTEPNALRAIQAADFRAAKRVAKLAEQGALPFELQQLGQCVRDFGRADALQEGSAKESAHRCAVVAASKAVAIDAESVVGLRAYQAHLFLRKLKEYLRTGLPSNDLLELAGSFVRNGRAFHWFDPATATLAMGESELLALYKKRWNEITGLKGERLALSIDEERTLFGFWLSHPPVSETSLAKEASDAARRARAVLEAEARNVQRLEKIRSLGKLDPSYPAAFAEGVVRFQQGRFEEAAVAFERHLAAHPDGPWTLRARNHLKAALEAR